MPGAGRKVQYVAGLSDALFVTNREQHAAALDDCHLFMWMIVRRGNNIRSKMQATDHQVLANDHLSFDAFFQLFNWNTGPVGVFRLNLRLFNGCHFLLLGFLESDYQD